MKQPFMQVICQGNIYTTRKTREPEDEDEDENEMEQECKCHILLLNLK